VSQHGVKPQHRVVDSGVPHGVYHDGPQGPEYPEEREDVHAKHAYAAFPEHGPVLREAPKGKLPSNPPKRLPQDSGFCLRAWCELSHQLSPASSQVKLALCCGLSCVGDPGIQYRIENVRHEVGHKEEHAGKGESPGGQRVIVGQRRLKQELP